MIKDAEGLLKEVKWCARELAGNCKKVFLAVSGGIDSATVLAILCEEFGLENVVGLYRDIKSNPKHKNDVILLQAVFGFHLIKMDLNHQYENGIAQIKEQFVKAGLPWEDENSSKAQESGFTNAYASLKSCMTTPWASFISKAIDSGRGRIFGTGNGEEDGILRYFDKRGDGAVDNNILDGLTKAEVRQLAKLLGVPKKIITKIPSADLEASGDAHNDEDQLTKQARSMEFDITLSYGSPDGSEEGNIAWAWKEDIRRGVITGIGKDFSAEDLNTLCYYTEEQVDLILYLRVIEKSTRHKVEPIPGLDRAKLMELGLVY